MKEKQFVNLLDAPFSRRGSYITFANDNFGENIIGKSNLWLCNCRTVGFAMTNMLAPNNYRQILLQATKDGFPLSAFIQTTPYEVILQTNQGEIRFCIGEKSLVMARGTDGLGLKVTPLAKLYQPASLAVTDEPDRRMIDFDMSRIVYTPLIGSTRAGQECIDLQPDDDGIVQAVFEDFLLDPDLRKKEEYPSYEACVRNVKEEFDAFCEVVMPELPGEYEEMRLQALWQTWSMMVDPDGENDYKRPMVKMVHSIFEQAFVWQMPMQAIWLSRDPKLSWEVLCSSFEFQDRHGRLSDAVAFKHVPGGIAMKPPVQGMALLWLMDHGIIDAAQPSEEDRKWLLERLIRWTDFYYNYRDSDRDGLCEYFRFLETGWEDAPQYMMGMPLASPDLNALLALQLEAIARFGATLGMPEQEQESYRNRSKEAIARLLARFWDGEKWSCFAVETGQRSDSDNLSLHLPLILGRRLPDEVIEKSIANLFREGGFNSPYGITSEAMDSKYFHHGFAAGSVITPAHFFFCMALDDCGRHDLAVEIANKYCRTLKEHGFFHINNALTGREDRSLTAFGERGLFWSAWTSSCYLFLASRYGKEQ